MAETIVDDCISEDDLLRFEHKYQNEFSTGHVRPNTQFEYGWCLVRSKYREDIRKGLNLLEGLCTTNMDQRDFLFFIAIGYYKLGEYSNALKYVKRLLSIEPSNYQAKDLEQLIEKKMRSDGLLGLAMVGGAALVGILVAAAVVKRGGK